MKNYKINFNFQKKKNKKFIFKQKNNNFKNYKKK